MDRSSTGSELMPARPDAPEFIKMPIPFVEEHRLKYFTPSQAKCDYQVLKDEQLAERCAYLLKRAYDDKKRRWEEDQAHVELPMFGASHRSLLLLASWLLAPLFTMFLPLPAPS